MSTFTPDDVGKSLSKLRWPLRMTQTGMLAEQVVQALWPLLTVVLLTLAALMLGLQDSVMVEVVWAAAVVLALCGLLSIVYAFRRFEWPNRAAAMERLDASLPGRPIQAMLDDAAIGGDDDASMAVWRAHKSRMAARAAQAGPVAADLRVSDRDPYALRYVAVLAFAVALIFGSVWRVGSVVGMAPTGAGLASGPVWEGWAEPPRYTGRPRLYLNDLDAGPLDLPAGTLITLRFYGDVGALTLAETVSGRTVDLPAASDPAQDFAVVQEGSIAIEGPGGRSWSVTMRPDTAPEVNILGEAEVAALGEMRLPFSAQDDYGVEAGEARFVLDLTAVDRRHGLTIDPDPRAQITVPLPTPISGDRATFEENLIEDFSKHPWANLPVKLTLAVLDAAEQQGETLPQDMVLPGRRFFNPSAAALIEMRRDLLWSKANASRTAQILRTIAFQPEDVIRSETTVLRLRQIIERLEIRARFGLDDDVQDDLAEDLWGLAIELEEGVLADALERLRRAQERLQEAMKNGASDEEIAELMDELRRATEEYMRQLQRQQAENGQQDGEQQQQQGESMQMTQDDLQRMMDRIQELMEEGRMAEAAEALQQLQEMMENMRVTEGQQGQGSQSPGEQAMEDLADTLRQQQGLSDQAFRDLQEQFNPGAQAGENQGNEGRNGGQGRGQSHEGQNGQGQGSDQQQGQNQQGQNHQGGNQPMPEGGEQGDGFGKGEEGLAQRQEALRDELRRQQSNLPGQGTPEGDAARDALDRAGRAMDQAEEALRNQDLAEAIDNQAQAMEALREGMRSLGEAMAQEQQQDQQPGQGTTESDRRAENRDPLGREQGTNGATGSEGPLALGPDRGARARELLDEIRRRSGETARPEVERDYLNRLLDRF
ncbi:DUF4175 domain containing protein [Sulfitobacter noctilucae]|uniref:TIGR02302 family protein n=1 Tax=Sulfitobacter noctilucae TaxID=1342302 RepID=UPI000468F08A|nr:TIGR02302 family protein [Sulfitobacter noctilucae]KIN60137.1 DUF4175 domain containing protein [Sulfitobacter noctilucae]